ncbi:MAG: hypothetical protein HKK67_11385 [Chlorobiaceae bacterium]|nr:hypothetical protein [Chlorobiaceae bacterium]
MLIKKAPTCEGAFLLIIPTAFISSTPHPMHHEPSIYIGLVKERKAYFASGAAASTFLAAFFETFFAFLAFFATFFSAFTSGFASAFASAASAAGAAAAAGAFASFAAALSAAKETPPKIPEIASDTITPAIKFFFMCLLVYGLIIFFGTGILLYPINYYAPAWLFFQ